MGDDNNVGIVGTVALAIGIVIGMVFGVNLERWSWHREAIKHDCAEYSSTTGVWQWKDK